MSLITVSAITATIGERSIIPSLGVILLAGLRNGSVDSIMNLWNPLFIGPLNQLRTIRIMIRTIMI